MVNKIISDVVVYSAGGFAFITSIPQLYQIIKTKKVRDLNPYFFVYGILEKDYILSISVSMPAACNFIIFLLWILYNDNEEILEKDNQDILIENKDMLIENNNLENKINNEIKIIKIILFKNNLNINNIRFKNKL